MAPTRIELLQRMPVFGAIGEAALDFIVSRARVVEVAAGDAFFRQGDAPQGMYVLEAGRAEAHKVHGDATRVIGRFAPGDCFGEMALLDLHPRSATVVAVEPCRALAIGPDDLYALYRHDLESFALIQMNLAREMSRRLRITDELLFHLDTGAAGSIRPRA